MCRLLSHALLGGGIPMADLKTFLTNLSTDPALKSSYNSDPNKAMMDADLPDNVRQAVLSGDRARIAQHLGAAGQQAFMVSVNVTITLGV
jgi:hypothetical protein